jgi:hypothetical protein
MDAAFKAVLKVIWRLPNDLAEIRYDERHIVPPTRKNGTIRLEKQRGVHHRGAPA